ncbi:MAG: NTP transferase domain-containing protein [Caulobacter sp.]|nr:NTP transferase domain-containing protein [Caulobacter sp.]
MRGRDGEDGADLMVVVLAGGAGRRMGGGKPLRLLRGHSLISIALDKARGWSPRVAVSVRSPDQVGPVDAPLILDGPDIAGPLAGLAAALDLARLASVPRLLTLPCDMPGLPDDLARRLCEALVPDAGAVVATCGGRLHPVCAVWDVRVRADLPAYIAAGRSSVKGFAEVVGMETVDWTLQAAPAFSNLNTPADLDQAMRRRP